MRSVFRRLFRRCFKWGVYSGLCLILSFSAALAGKSADKEGRPPKPKPIPVKPHNQSSNLSISVQIDPVISVDPTPDLLPTNFALQQNYPNPFNSSTTITFSCAKESFVSIKAYNVLGQEVATLVSGRMKPGLHSIIWNSRDREGNLLPSGVYLYRMRTDWYLETRKLLILR
jgi:hypothetical protein